MINPGFAEDPWKAGRRPGDTLVRQELDKLKHLPEPERTEKFKGGILKSLVKPEVTEAQQRKQRPLYSGVLAYFPDALLEVAHCSWVGNEQHNPGEKLHWAKEKSTDELDALLRHSLEAGTLDTDGVRHSAKIAWRALANLQREIEAEREKETQG